MNNYKYSQLDFRQLSDIVLIFSTCILIPLAILLE